MALVGKIKAYIRRAIGVWPAMELWNKFVMAPALPRLIWFENREVARSRSQLGIIPTAQIACIVPTFKRPEGVVAAVNSILMQERQDFVIIVVDDGAGLPVLPDDPRVFSVSLSRNCGVVGMVRNVGIRLSSSKFIAFLDDDNIWTPQHLTVAMRALEGNVDLVYTAVRRRKPDGSEFDILSKPFDRRRFFGRNLVGGYERHCPAKISLPAVQPPAAEPQDDAQGGLGIRLARQPLLPGCTYSSRDRRVYGQPQQLLYELVTPRVPRQRPEEPATQSTLREGTCPSLGQILEKG